MVKATQYLNDAKQAFEDRDFNKAKELSDKIIRMKAAAFEANKLINEIKEGIRKSKERGINVDEAERFLNLAVAAFEREDFETALKRAQDAQLTYLLISKGKFNILWFLKTYWWAVLIVLLLLSAGGSIVYKKLALTLIERKIEDLDKEDSTINKLIIELQEKTYKKKELSVPEYHKQMASYEKRLSNIGQSRTRLRSRRAGIIKTANEIEILKKEDGNVVEKTKALQDSYYNKQNLTKRQYERRNNEYKIRRTEIEKSIVVLETKLAKKEKLEELKETSSKKEGLKPKNKIGKIIEAIKTTSRKIQARILQPKTLQTKPAPGADKVEFINKRIEDAKEALSKYDLEKAKDIYDDVLEVYTSLPPEDKRKTHAAVKEIYDKRKELESKEKGDRDIVKKRREELEGKKKEEDKRRKEEERKRKEEEGKEQKEGEKSEKQKDREDYQQDIQTGRLSKTQLDQIEEKIRESADKSPLSEDVIARLNKEIKPIPGQEKLVQKARHDVNNVEFIKQRIIDAKEALSDSNFQRARTVYKDVLNTYNKLSPENKTRTHDLIKELYEKRKELEKLERYQVDQIDKRVQESERRTPTTVNDLVKQTKTFAQSQKKDTVLTSLQREFNVDSVRQERKLEEKKKEFKLRPKRILEEKSREERIRDIEEIRETRRKRTLGEQLRAVTESTTQQKPTIRKPVKTISPSRENLRVIAKSQPKDSVLSSLQNDIIKKDLNKESTTQQLNRYKQRAERLREERFKEFAPAKDKATVLDSLQNDIIRKELGPKEIKIKPRPINPPKSSIKTLKERIIEHRETKRLKEQREKTIVPKPVTISSNKGTILNSLRREMKIDDVEKKTEPSILSKPIHNDDDLNPLKTGLPIRNRFLTNEPRILKKETSEIIEPTNMQPLPNLKPEIKVNKIIPKSKAQQKGDILNGLKGAFDKNSSEKNKLSKTTHQ